MNLLNQSKSTTILPVFIVLTFVCFVLSPQARAVCQQGCLTNDNTVLGDDALLNNANGTFNTAIGVDALLNNANGNGNTALGFEVLQTNTIGDGNTATGYIALLNNTTGSGNTVTGADALLNNTTGNGNTAIGVNALFSNITGSHNIAVGVNAGDLLHTGSYNIYIGSNGGTGAHGEHESGVIRIGGGRTTSAYIAGISGVTVADGVGVIVGANGHLGTVVSSARFKESIKPMDKASEAILALKPVTFRYKHDLDPKGIPQFGLVAEDVEKVNPDLVARDEQDKPYTVRYEAINAMLLNEFLKEHRTVQELKSIVAKQEADAAQQRKQIEALTAALQKVSDQLELSKSAPQTVLNDQ